jgi:hypothetical protein
MLERALMKMISLPLALSVASAFRLLRAVFRGRGVVVDCWFW